MTPKKWYESKTLWFNVIAFVIAVLENYGYTGVLPDEWLQFVPLVVIVVNFLLRLITKQPVAKTLI